MKAFIDNFSQTVATRYANQTVAANTIVARHRNFWLDMAVFYFDLEEVLDEPNIDKAFVQSAMDAINLHLRLCKIRELQHKYRDIMILTDVFEVYMGGDVPGSDAALQHEAKLDQINKNFTIWAKSGDSTSRQAMVLAKLSA